MMGTLAQNQFRLQPLSMWKTCTWNSISRAKHSLLPNAKAWMTNEYEHNGLGADGEKILDRLITMTETIQDVQALNTPDRVLSFLDRAHPTPTRQWLPNRRTLSSPGNCDTLDKATNHPSTQNLPLPTQRTGSEAFASIHASTKFTTAEDRP